MSCLFVRLDPVSSWKVLSSDRKDPNGTAYKSVVMGLLNSLFQSKVYPVLQSLPEQHDVLFTIFYQVGARCLSEEVLLPFLNPLFVDAGPQG